MPTLILLAHADSSIKPTYEAALGSDVRVVPFVAPGPGMSSAYTRLADRLRVQAKFRDQQGILPALLAHLGVRHDPHTEALVLACWSGGYALLREVAKNDADVAQVAAWVLLDGGHTALEADGTALDTGVRWAVTLALRAARQECVFAMLHSDVHTPQTGPSAYASTTQFASELRRIAGEPRGAYMLEAYDTQPPTKDAAEHIAALRTLGPDFVRRALNLIPSHNTTSPPTPTPCTQPRETLRAAALQIAQREVGVREEPMGSNTGPRVREYLAGCQRGGVRIGLTSGAWCAAFVGWCDNAALKEVQAQPPCSWRAAVNELVRDAVRAGAWRPKPYAPHPGDLVILKRLGQDPTLGGLGHVGRVETYDPATGAMTSIEGNHENCVGRAVHYQHDSEVVGFIAYP